MFKVKMCHSSKEKKNNSANSLHQRAGWHLKAQLLSQDSCELSQSMKLSSGPAGNSNTLFVRPSGGRTPRWC